MKAGWEVKPLGAVAEVISGQSPKGANCNAKGKGTPFFQGKKEFGERFIGEPTAWTTQVTRLAKANDILMSVRAPVGPVNLASQDLCIGRGLAAIRPNEGITTDFLFYCLESKQSEIKGSEGAVFPSINRTQIESIRIPVPPLPEQRRIVALLDDAFESIAAAKANAEKSLRNARELFDSHLYCVFSRLSCDKAPLESLVEAESPITYGVVKPGGEGEVRFVRGGDVAKGRVLIDKLRTISKKVSEQYRRTLLQGGELLVSLVGQPGQVAIAPAELRGANIARQVGLVRLSKRMVPEFVRLFLQSPVGQKELLSKQSGSVQQVINLSELREIRVPLLPDDEQRTCVTRLLAMQADTERLVSPSLRKLAALDELKASLLHQAFSGQL